MIRTWTMIGLFALLSVSAGCRMCATCGDNAGPVDPANCPNCAVGRSGSAFAGSTTVIEGSELQPTPAYDGSTALTPETQSVVR